MCADIVGFGDAGVWTALGNGDGTFQAPQFVLAKLGYENVLGAERTPRLLAGLTGSKLKDIIVFGDDGVSTALGNGDGTFQPPRIVLGSFGYNNLYDVYSTPAQARRFFASPYDSTLIYLVDTNQIKVSYDGGRSWSEDSQLQALATWGGLIPAGRGEDATGQGDHLDMVLTDMQFDPYSQLHIFAVGEGGAFVRNGPTWVQLLDSQALPGRPANCYYDQFSTLGQKALYVAFAGRSLVKIVLS
jgi:hypothetical protein